MGIRWNGEYMSEVLALPAAVADEYLCRAGKLSLMVLLWYARHPRGPLDIAACAADLKKDPEDCEDAVRFWVKHGILTDGDVAVPTPPREEAVVSAVTVPTVPASAPVATVPAPRPAAVKPQMHEVTARAAQSPKFAELLNTVSSRMGRPLSGGDMETLLYLFDTAGLPAEIIIMVVNWAVSHEKGNIRYIEKMALDWADRGIVTMEAAEAHLCAQERRQKAFEQLAVMLQLEVAKPTAVQVDAADRWLNERKYDKALLKEALTRTMEKTGKFQVKYMDRILDGWFEEGITTYAQLEGAGKPPKAPSSLDTDGYEALLKNYVPT